MENKIIEVIVKIAAYTCMVLTAAALIFLFTGATAAAFNWMMGVFA